MGLKCVSLDSASLICCMFFRQHKCDILYLFDSVVNYSRMRLEKNILFCYSETFLVSCNNILPQLN